MTGFTQKYTINHFFEDIPDGYEYSMKDWPPHVTLADTFAIDGEWSVFLDDLRQNLNDQVAFFSKAIVKDLFGEDRSIKVTLIEKNEALQQLHETIVSVLEKHGVVFNSPQYTKSGFKPHSTDQIENSLEIGAIVEFGSVTLIDMFPDNDPFQRRVLGTIYFS